MCKLLCGRNRRVLGKCYYDRNYSCWQLQLTIVHRTLHLRRSNSHWVYSYLVRLDRVARWFLVRLRLIYKIQSPDLLILLFDDTYSIKVTYFKCSSYELLFILSVVILILIVLHLVLKSNR